MKISIITYISVLQFYGYIENISADILKKKNIDKPKIDQNSWKYKKKPHRNMIRSITNIFKLLY